MKVGSTRGLPLLLLLLAVSCSASTVRAGADKIADALGHEIIGPHQAQAEVELFTESRVRPLPHFDKAANWKAFAEQTRQQVLERVVFRGEAKRWRDAKTKVDWQDTIAGGPGYRIRKLRFEALPGLWIPALLYEPEQLAGKVPAVLNVNGHDPKGKA